MTKKLSIGFGTTILTIIAMLFSISNVKAYDFTGYKSFTQIYLHKDSANYEDNTCKFTSSDSHCSLLLRYDSFPYDKLVYKFYANTFNLTKDKEYRFTFFLYSTFDISTFTNNFVFRVGENDYTFTVVEPKHVKLEVERVGSNAYVTKVSLNFTSPYDGVPVLSLWMYDTSNASIDTYFGAYKYYMIQDAPTYIPEDDEEGFWFNTSSLEAFYSFDNLKQDLETYLTKNFANLTLNDVDYFCSDGNSYSDSLSITCQVSEKPGVFSITSTQYFGNVVKGNYTFSTVNSQNALINNGNATFSYTSLPSDAYYPQIKDNMDYYSTVDIYSDDGTLVFESSEKKAEVPTYTTEIIKELGQTTFSLNLSEYDKSIFQVVLCDNSSCYPVKTNSYSLKFKENNTLSLSIYEVSTNKKVSSEEFIIEVEPENNYIKNLKQVYSIDLLFDIDISNKNFSFKLESENAQFISWDSVQYLGLVYENGLFHWEEIEFDVTDNSIMIEDATEKCEDNIYTLNLTNVNFAKKTYQKTMLRLQLNNAIDIESIAFSKEMIINNTIFFNDVGYNYIKNRFLLSGNGIKYLNFSTNDEYQNTVYFDFLNPEHEGKLHLDIFDTSTAEFKEYGSIRPFAAVSGRYYANVDASTERKVGFWLTLGDLKNDTCEFIYSFPFEKIFWSESESTANGGKYISSDGTIKDKLTPSNDIVYEDANLNTVLKKLTNFIDKIRTPMTFFFKCLAYFYNSLNFYIKGLITSLLTIILMACVYKFVRRWNA